MFILNNYDKITNRGKERLFIKYKNMNDLKEKIKQLKNERRELNRGILDLREERNDLLREQRKLSRRAYEIKNELINLQAIDR